MDDLIKRRDVLEGIDETAELLRTALGLGDIVGTQRQQYEYGLELVESLIDDVKQMPPSQPEIIRCHQCGFWDRETLRHQHNDFRDWNEAECMMLAERDGYNEISHYVEADDYCSYAERRTDGSD